MQQLIRRTRPQTTTGATPDATPTATAPARRLRVTSDRLQRLAEDRQAILEDLKLISDAEGAIDRAQQTIDASVARIEAKMRDHNLPVMDNGTLIAEIKETFTRQQRTLDPKKFRSKVTNAQFWDCIEVSVSKASAYLGDKELNSIADVVPAKSLGYSLKIKPLKAKK